MKEQGDFIWELAHDACLTLGATATLMGILNVTPDSFSDGGLHFTTDRALEHAGAMMAEGAAIIDIGGESTRPGATPVSPLEEQRRILPIVEALSHDGNCLISIDTYHAETAAAALRSGAHIINDVHGLQREPAIARIAADWRAGLVIMHTGRDRQRHADVIEDQTVFLGLSLKLAEKAGISHSQILLDPGFGFAKDHDENFSLLAQLPLLHRLNQPLLVGTSRKRMIGDFAGSDLIARDIGTAATSVVMRLQGAAVFRVHNVAANRIALAFADQMLARNALLLPTD